MPSMTEIYSAHAAEYDELVDREDHEGNLGSFLRSAFDFDDKKIIELGTGTGRQTRIYADLAQSALCMDRSAHMLEKARKNLAHFADKLTFLVCDNLAAKGGSGGLAAESADCVIEGWSFGHTVVEALDEAEDTADRLVKNCESLCAEDGNIFIIETLGSNVDRPDPPGEKLRRFYESLETTHGFVKTVLSTDYRFQSVAEARRIFTWFFGQEMGNGIARRGSGIVPEFTGIWRKQMRRSDKTRRLS